MRYLCPVNPSRITASAVCCFIYTWNIDVLNLTSWVLKCPFLPWDDGRPFPGNPQPQCWKNLPFCCVIGWRGVFNFASLAGWHVEQKPVESSQVGFSSVANLFCVSVCVCMVDRNFSLKVYNCVSLCECLGCCCSCGRAGFYWLGRLSEFHLLQSLCQSVLGQDINGQIAHNSFSMCECTYEFLISRLALSLSMLPS